MSSPSASSPGRGVPRSEDGERIEGGVQGVTAALARFLRQREELGGPGLVLDRLTREEALGLLRGVGRGPAIGPAPQAPGSMGTPTRPSRAKAGRPDAAAPAAGGRDVGEGAGTPAPEPAGAVEELPRKYDELRELALRCRKCRLAEGRTQVVFSDGNPDGRLMVVGEAPGANEDRTGLPFVGQAGRFLDLLLASVDLSRRESVYICNVLKCRPPGNRDPRPDEIQSCAPYLKRQIELVEPEVILAVGTFAARLLTGRERPLGKLRGEVYSYEGVPLVVTYHPAALLRNPRWTRATWDDLQLLRRVLDES